MIQLTGHLSHTSSTLSFPDVVKGLLGERALLLVALPGQGRKQFPQDARNSSTIGSGRLRPHVLRAVLPVDGLELLPLELQLRGRRPVGLRRLRGHGAQAVGPDHLELLRGQQGRSSWPDSNSGPAPSSAPSAAPIPAAADDSKMSPVQQTSLSPASLSLPARRRSLLAEPTGLDRSRLVWAGEDIRTESRPIGEPFGWRVPGS
eukprot:scaffold651_cov252-Pinguiococcus_pyrenoidosus.AAC.3